jgi:hypothetical protein
MKDIMSKNNITENKEKKRERYKELRTKIKNLICKLMIILKRPLRMKMKRF